MYNSYVVRLADGKVYSFYYTLENGISFKVNENGRWSRATSLIVDAKENFTVNLGNDGRFYIFYADRENDIKLCTNKTNENQSFISKPIMNNSSENGKYFSAIISSKGINLLYESPNSDKINNIVSQKLSDGGWSEREFIDKHIFQNEGGGFYIHVVHDDHAIIFYQTQKSGRHLGYREITMNKVGSFNTFHITSSVIISESFLTTNASIHFLYIVRSMFSCQLIYRRKHSEGFTAAVVAAEAVKMDNCLIFIINNKIYACFLINNLAYICTSDDGGNTFSKPQRYRNKFCESPSKAALLSHSYDENIFCAREVYVDSLNPWDVQIIPELYDDFYAPLSPPVTVLSVPEENKPPEKPSEAEIYYGSDISNEDKLKNQIDMLQQQLIDKDKQIIFLQNELQSKNN